MKARGMIFLILIVLISCGNDPEQPSPVETDISVSAFTSVISWEEKSDLELSLANSIFFDSGLALESEVEKKIEVATDSSLAIASISFLDEFRTKYRDPEPYNNFVTIILEKLVPDNSVVLRADGIGDTYQLITSVLAPGYNPIEVPDCNHPAFGDHIDEVFDVELDANVFQFYIHTTTDNDRCIVFDRQRNEIKTYDKSPDNLKGIQGETVVYKWKFKLPKGFQTSPNFTHIHQLKSVGGSLASQPMYTLTTRKGSPDKLELRYAETDNSSALKTTDLAPFLGEWVEVIETITYGTSGTYDFEIRKVSDGSLMFEYSNSDIINWRPDASFVRPKWGIYRSLNNAQDLRDEIVLFADFSVEEL